jgi:hypothetical protein
MDGKLRLMIKAIQLLVNEMRSRLNAWQGKEAPFDPDSTPLPA